MRGDAGADLRRRQQLARDERAPAGHRHLLDEARDEIALPGERAQRAQLAVVETLDGDGVDLDRRKAGGSRRFGAGQHAVKLAALQRVQADVQAIDTGPAQRRRQLGQEVAVGRQGDLVDAGDPAQHPHQGLQVAAHRRFAAGQAHAPHAQRGETAHQIAQLFERQDVGAVDVLDALLGHAVGAAVIAAVGDGDAQVIDRPALFVDERRGFSHDGAGGGDARAGVPGQSGAAARG